jgi:cell division protein FtsI/penicillin-binding protein 2
MSYRPSERLLFVSFGVSFLFMAIVMRSFYLQVVAREEILARGDWNHRSERVIQAGRGDIVDRSGNNLSTCPCSMSGVTSATRAPCLASSASP